jgi:hypothetical protein
VLAVIVSALTLFFLGLIPFQQSAIGIHTAMVFISQFAITFVVLPIGALMAYTVPEEFKGRAAGWYQAGISVAMESAAAPASGLEFIIRKKSPELRFRSR